MLNISPLMCTYIAYLFKKNVIPYDFIKTYNSRNKSNTRAKSPLLLEFQLQLIKLVSKLFVFVFGLYAAINYIHNITHTSL